LGHLRGELGYAAGQARFLSDINHGGVLGRERIAARILIGQTDRQDMRFVGGVGGYQKFLGPGVGFIRSHGGQVLLRRADGQYLPGGVRGRNHEVFHAPCPVGVVQGHGQDKCFSRRLIGFCRSIVLQEDFRIRAFPRGIGRNRVGCENEASAE